MESVFACYDRQESGKFWTSRMHMYPILSIAEDSGLYQGDLFIRRDANVLKKRHFSSADRRVLKYVGINWKILEPFEEVSTRESVFGFRLSGATDYFDFYTKDEDALVYWLDHLSKFTINTGLREDYQLINEIARGLQATVYKAKELLTGKKFVVKLVPKSQSSLDSEYLSSIKQEITLLRALKHPNIVTFHKVYEDKKCVALVLSYVRGLDLAKYILKTGSVPEVCARQLIKRILETLVYLRSNGLMHNALVPSNILVSCSEDLSEFKLCDFGAASTDIQECNQDLVSLASTLITALTGKFSMQSAASRTQQFSEVLQDFISKLSLRTEFLDPGELLNHQWLDSCHQPILPSHRRRSLSNPQLKKSLKLLKKSMRREDLVVYLQLANLEFTVEEISDWSDEEEESKIEEGVDEGVNEGVDEGVNEEVDEGVYERVDEGVDEETTANTPSVLPVQPNAR